MQNLDLNQVMIPVFYTPLVNYLWTDSEALHQQLIQHIQALEKKTRGVVKSNVGGWHSDLAFMQNSSACIQTLRKRLLQFVKAYTKQICGEPFLKQAKPVLEGWANILRHGQYNSTHNHPNCYWSGIYYLTDNEAIAEHPFSGKLELLDPRPGASITYQDNDLLYGRFLLSPRAGQMIIFPSWLMHSVHPYFGEQERISIAFNIRFK